MAIQFKIYRDASGETAADCDMGDLDIIVGDRHISSVGNGRFFNMIYISIVDLIDGLLRLNKDGGECEFVGADSSFIVDFEVEKKGLYIRHCKEELGPVALHELLKAISIGLENFLSDPRNRLPREGAVYRDFHASWASLKESIS